MKERKTDKEGNEITLADVFCTDPELVPDLVQTIGFQQMLAQEQNTRHFN